MVCLAYAQWQNFNKRTPMELLVLGSGRKEKEVWAAMQKAHEHGCLEYAKNLGLGWLTEEGKKLIQ